MISFPFALWKASGPPPVPVTLYSNNSVSTNWNDVGNWWLDAGYTIPALRIPISGDTVYSNLASEDTVYPAVSLANFYGLGVTGAGNNGALTVASSGNLQVTGGCWFGNCPDLLTAVFTSSAWNYATLGCYNIIEFRDVSQNAGSINAYVTFYDSAINIGTCNMGAVFKAYSKNSGNIASGYADFYDYSENTSSASTIDNASFHDYSYNSGGVNNANLYDHAANAGGIYNVNFYGSSANTTGYIGYGEFYDYSQNTLGGVIYYATEFHSYSTNIGTAYDYVYFYDGASNYGVMNGNAVFFGSSYNAYVDGLCNFAAYFHDSSLNYGTVFGFSTFTDSSTNTIYGHCVSDASFDNASTNYGIVEGGSTFGSTYGSTAVNGGTVNNSFSGINYFYHNCTNTGTAFYYTNFYDNSNNAGFAGWVAFYNNSENSFGGTCNLHAEFWNDTINYGAVNYDAFFYDNSNQFGGVNLLGGTTTCSTTGVCP